MIALVVKATVLLVVALVAAGAARRARASVRYALLLATFVALALLPVGLLTLSPIAVPILRPNSTEVNDDTTLTLPASSPRVSTRRPGETPTVARPTGWRAIDITAMIAVAWAAGTAVTSLALGIGIARVRRLRRTALPCVNCEPLVRQLASATGMRARVDVLIHEDIATPVTFGVVRSAVVLPSDAPEWGQPALRAALVHELEHVRRRDWATQVFARAVCAMFWFHPLGWMAYRQLCLAAEHACDDAVVAREESTMYAEQLVNLARRMRGQTAFATVGMASRSDLSARISAVLDAGRARGPAGSVPVSVISIAAAALLAVTAPLQLAASASASARERSGELRRELAEAASVREGGPTFAPDGAMAGKPSAPGDSAQRPSRLDRALVEAADEGDLDDVRELLDRGGNVNAAVDGDGTPLITAARSGHIDIVRLLLERGADVNLPVSGDGTPLIMAAREGHIEIVRLLLDRGADIDLMVSEDENALIQASGEGHLAVVELLVSRGANVNARAWAERAYERPAGEWRTPLSVATRGGHRDVAAFLRAHGAQ